jgi:hypothetical protein
VDDEGWDRRRSDRISKSNNRKNGTSDKTKKIGPPCR